MAEITNLFKATVKAMKSRHKAQGLNIGPDKSILPSKKNSGFASNSKLVVSLLDVFSLSVGTGPDTMFYQ